MTMSDETIACPNCLQSLGTHWVMGMPEKKLDLWMHDEEVCTLTQEEVRLLLTS